MIFVCWKSGMHKEIISFNRVLTAAESALLVLSELQLA